MEIWNPQETFSQVSVRRGICRWEYLSASADPLLEPTSFRVWQGHRLVILVNHAPGSSHARPLEWQSSFSTIMSSIQYPFKEAPHPKKSLNYLLYVVMSSIECPFKNAPHRNNHKHKTDQWDDTRRVDACARTALIHRHQTCTQDLLKDENCLCTTMYRIQFHIKARSYQKKSAPPGRCASLPDARIDSVPRTAVDDRRPQR